MEILITSDTHGFHDVISDYLLTHDDIDLLIHAGDGLEDVKYISYETGINYFTVAGNNDYAINYPKDEVLDIKGYKIFLTHGDKYNVHMGYDNILKRAIELSCDIAIFGHTHRYLEIIKEDVLLINPGSPTLPRDDNPGFMILSIDQAGKIHTQRISLKN